jgi:hypothetical protein
MSELSNAREILFARLLAIRQRMWPDADPNQDMSEALAERTDKHDGITRQAIKRIKLSEDVEPAPSTPVEPTPAPYTMPASSQVYVGRSGPNLISDDEYPQGMCDTTTQNWRKSLEASKPRVPQEEVNALDLQEVERALQKQMANVIPFRVSK